MSSFEKPFRGLPAEIRVMIWEYVTLSVIEVVGIWCNDAVETSAFEEDDQPESDDQLAVWELEFRPSLSSLVAIAQASRVTHQEFAAAIDKTGLSFDVTLISDDSLITDDYFCRLIERFNQPSTPRIELLRVCNPAHVPYSNTQRLDLRDICWTLDRERFSEGDHACIPRLEFVIQGQVWDTDAAAVEDRTLDYRDSPPYFRPFPNADIAAYERATELIGMDFLSAIRCVARNIFGEVVFDFKNLDEDHIGIVMELDNYWRGEWPGPELECKDCSIDFGPICVQQHATDEQNTPITYRYQIVFRRTPGPAHYCPRKD